MCQSQCIEQAAEVQQNITLHFYNASGNMLMRRHPINNRAQQQVLRQYVATVKEVGIIPGVRGQPWGVLSEGGDGKQGGDTLVVLQS